MNIATEGRQFSSDPTIYFEGSYKAAHSVPREQLERLQLEALRQRFDEMRGGVQMLTALADELGVTAIDKLEDVVPLLFKHTVYKSYPVSLLEKGRFDQITKWLGRLTTVDLSSLNFDGITTIDGWFDAFDTQSELRLSHSSGTSGTMSFFPRTDGEMHLWFRTTRMLTNDATGLPANSEEPFHCIWPTYRRGCSTILRSTDYQIQYFCGGDESKFHVLNPGRMSSDVMFLAGRLRNAAARGEVAKIEISPELRARREEFESTQQNLRQSMMTFLADAIEKLKGERVIMVGASNQMYEIARSGLERGLKNVFAPDSLIQPSGGAKGQVQPDGWREVIKEFNGVDKLMPMYSMSEVMGAHSTCEHDRYHIAPWTILFVLDPDTGEVYPRSGQHTGRAAFFDTMAKTYWGGFVTGDEVSVDWEPCKCGLTTPHISHAIERYSEKRGGDDKISCAAADGAHESAIDFLTNALD